MNQAGIYAVVTNWCYKFALKKEEREHIPTLVDNRIMANAEPEEVEMLRSSPNQAQGNLMMQIGAKFRVLEKKVHITQLCENAFFQYLVTAATKFDQMEKTDVEKLHLYAERIY